MSALNKEQEEEFREIARTVVDESVADSSTTSIDVLEEDIDRASRSKVHDILMDIERIANGVGREQGKGGAEQVKILKGAVDGILKSANPGVNEADLNGKLGKLQRKGKLLWLYLLAMK